MLLSPVPMNAEALFERSPSLGDAEIFLVAWSRPCSVNWRIATFPVGACLTISSAPLLYRASPAGGQASSMVTRNRTREQRLAASAASTFGNRSAWNYRSPTSTSSGITSKISPVNCPTSTGKRRSPTEIALGCLRTGESGGQVGRRGTKESRTRCWRGGRCQARTCHRRVADFPRMRGGRSTRMGLSLQYAPPAGKAGALVASLFGREPSQTVREDLRHFKQRLEAGGVPRARASV